MATICPHLWFIDNAHEAAKLYTSIFPDSHVDSVTTLPSESPSGPSNTVGVVTFTLLGQPFKAISAGPLDPFNHAISFVVECDTQDEIDRYWDALLSDGGETEQCGWLRDRYGVSWQIVPAALDGMIADPDRRRAKRASDAMLSMVKLDLAELEAAFAPT
jgi:predicted 3-demethylubiquinone-9 3-methyltransferase (glyoxalase superfamily)